MKIPIPKDSTSVLINVFIQDATRTDGEGLTGLVYNTTGLIAYYYKDNATASVQITLATLTTLGTWETGGFKEIDSTGLPGWYQLGLPNAALVAGPRTVAVHLRGALNGLGVLNMAPCANEILLTAGNEQIYAGLKRNRAFTDFPFVLRNSTTKALEASATSIVVARKIDSGSFGTGGLTNVQNIGAGIYTLDGIASDVNGLFVTFKITGANVDPCIVSVITSP